MQQRKSSKLANMAAVLTCLLAVTAFLAGSWQARAQSPTATHGNRSSASAGGLVNLAGHTPPKVLNGRAIRVSHYNPENKLRLALGVQRPHPADEEEFIKELVTKGSPNFHKFLTAAEWNARFSPSVEDEQQLVDWAKSQGLTVTNRYANRLLVDVEAPVGAIEKVFGVTINNYQVGDEVDFSNDRDPVIPGHLDGILSTVLGLQNIDRMHGMMQGARNAKGPDYVPGPAFAQGPHSNRDAHPSKKPSSRMASMASGPTGGGPQMTNGYIDPSDLYSSQGYDYGALANLDHCCNVHNDSGGSPAVSSIAIVAWAGIDINDMNAFVDQYGMAYNIYQLWIDGESSPPNECGIGNPPTSPCTGDADTGDGGVEAAVDTEFSLAYANSFGSWVDTAAVNVYEAANTNYSTFSDLYNDIVSNNYAKVVTTSWDWTDADFGSASEMNTLHGIFNSMTGEGLTLINAAGDQGSTSDCTDAVRVFWPAEDPNFLAAGGTELTLNPTTGAFESEVAWTGGTSSNSCSSNGGGGGGGVSTFFSQPSWQNGLTYEYYDPSDSEYWVVSGSTARLLPDISLNAGGTWENFYHNGWSQVLGTSIVGPQLAGFFARENTYLDYIGDICGSGTSACTPVGLPSQFIYWNGGGSAAHDPFYDTLTGCNSNNITAEYSLISYCATTGWDAATGWGSANVMQLAWGINYNLIPAYGEPVITFSGPSTNTWYHTDQEVSWTVTTINTRSGSTTPPPGVAGFTQGWDSIPSDPYSEPHGGGGNSFYSGPEYPFATGGCLSFNGLGGCSGGAQGCHTAHVEAWDNQGDPAIKTYGPVCVDTVVPTISAGTIPVTSYTTWVNRSVQVALTATDPGGSNASGILRTYYAINTGSCYPGNLGPCSIYTGPFTVSGQQQSYIYYFTEDNAGNFSTEPYLWVSIDLTPPVTAASLSGTLIGSDYDTAVQVTLNATDTGGSGVLHTYYQLDGGSTITYSGAAFTVSTPGSHTVKYWSVDGAGNTEATKSVTFFEAAPSALISPTPGTVLAGTNVTFTWTAGTGVTLYDIYVGTAGVGSDNLYTTGHIAATSATVTGLPAIGATIYVRLWSEISGAWTSTDYIYTEAGMPAKAVLTTPTPGSTFTGTSESFTWTTGNGVALYALYLGTTGVGSSNLYNSGHITATSTTVTGLPAIGATVYARLWSEISGAWTSTDYIYTEAGMPAKAVLTTPTPGSAFTGTSESFTWTTGNGVTLYALYLGTTGVGSSNLYNSGHITATSTTVTGLPAIGATVYARLWSYISGAWQSTDYIYTESGMPVKAVLTSPAPSSTFTGTSESFAWTTGNGVTLYALYLGTTGVGSSNLYNSGHITATSTTVTGLPATGATVYARLWSYIGGVWQSNDYTYTEQ
jgi:hypothetical protein